MLKRFLILIAVAFALLGASPALAQYNPTTSQISPNSTSQNSNNNSTNTGTNTGANTAGSSTGSGSSSGASGSSSGSSGSSSGSLPSTGTNALPLLVVGAGLVVFGGMILLATRRRSTPVPS